MSDSPLPVVFRLSGLAAAVSLAFALQACGGGGGSSGQAAPKAQTPSPQTQNAPEDDPPVVFSVNPSTDAESEIARLRSLGYSVFEVPEAPDFVPLDPEEAVAVYGPDELPLPPAEEGTARAASAGVSKPAIVGGSFAADGQFPWITFVQNGSGYCSGSLIAPQWVLTAAHCVPSTGTTSTSLVATVGYNSSSTARQVIASDYFIRLANDLALVHLSQASTFTPLAYNGTQSADAGGTVRTVGFGKTSATEGGGILKYVDNTAIDANPSSAYMVVGVDGGMQTACYGDSGGPTIKYSASGLPMVHAVNSATYPPACTGRFSASRTSFAVTAIVEATGVPPGQYPSSNQAPSITQVQSMETDLVATSVQFTATDPEGDRIVYSATGLPAGLSINRDTGLVTGTPSAYSVTPSNVTVTATDSKTGASRSTSFIWRINSPGNADPSIQPVPNQTHVAGSVVSVPLSASDPNGDAVSFSATGLPPGVTVGSGSGGAVLSGSPSAKGVYQVNVNAFDRKGGYAMTSFVWEVTNTSPTITKIADKTVSVGSSIAPIVIQVSDAENHPVNVTVQYLPRGLSYNPSTKTISGVVSDAGSYMVYIQASDGFGGYASSTFNINVNSSTNRPPTMTPLTNQTTLPGVQVSIPVIATDPDGHRPMPVFKGLPPGILYRALATGPVISGAAIRGGIYTVTYYVVDGYGGRTDYEPFTWTVPNESPVLQVPSSATLQPGVVAPVPFTLSDPEGHAMTIQSVGLPRGMVANPVAKAITGAPLVGGVFQATLTATDRYGAKSAPQSITITVPNDPPVIGSPVQPMTTAAGTLVSVPLDVSDPNGHPLIITATPGRLPPGLSINAVSKTIVGRPTSAGIYNVTLVVADRYGAKVNMPPFQWTVTNQSPVVSAIGAQSSVVGRAVSFKPEVSDPDGNAVRVSATGLPPGLRVYANAVVGTPTTVGTYAVNFKVSDVYGMASAPIPPVTWTVTSQ